MAINIEELTQLTQEQRDALTSERDALTTERDNLTAERDALISERDELKRQYEEKFGKGDPKPQDDELEKEVLSHFNKIF